MNAGRTMNDLLRTEGKLDIRDIRTLADPAGIAGEEKGAVEDIFPYVPWIRSMDLHIL